MKQNYIKKSIAIATLALGVIGMQAQTTFNYTGSLETYTVPAGISLIKIEATGAEGGIGSNGAFGTSGKGAKMTGDFTVTSGQVLNILVAEEGADADWIGGGGGGSFVWDSTTTTLLIAAGGGGGGGGTDNGNTAITNGIDAVVDTNATNGNGMPDGAGTNGNGGSQPNVPLYWASGGAGWLTDGVDGFVNACDSISLGGHSPLNGGAGGSGGGNASTAADGGYGGGGGGNGRCGAIGGGGGGGYSGGGAGGEAIVNDYSAGGGGGSYNNGTNQTNTAGVGTGNGIVTITAICTLDTSISTSGYDITSNQTGATYQWIECHNGNSAITGATNATYTVTANGDYAVVVTMGICSDTSACVNFSTVGINTNVLNSNNVSLYPNPTTNNVTINLGTLKNAQISIVTTTGKEVYSLNNVNEQEINVSLADFSNGVYFVKVKSNTEQKVIKLIKQ